MTLCLVFISCGKEVEENSPDSPEPRRERGVDPTDDVRVREFIAKQRVSCEDDYDCHESIAKVIVLDKSAVRHCVGTLVGDDTLLLASSCLTNSLRVPGVDCRQSVHVIFPKSAKHKKLVTSCKRVLSSDNSLLVDPALRRGDIARIQLDSKSSHAIGKAFKARSTRYSKRGFSEGYTFKVWKVDKLNEFEAVVKKELCKVLYNSYANPFVKNENSPFMTVSNCAFNPGNLGAALVGRNKNVRGLFSSPLSPTILNFLKERNLLSEVPTSIVHVSNLACLFSEDEQDCSEVKTEVELKKIRSEMLSRNSVHKKNKDKVKKELETYQKYFKWSFGFFLSTDRKEFEAAIEKPKCFYDIGSWLKEFGSGRRYKNWVTKKISYKNYSFKVKLDKNLKPISSIEEAQARDYFVSFSPQDIYSRKRTQVSVRTSIFGDEVRSIFRNVTSNCN
jgi:hypothetical protein